MSVANSLRKLANQLEQSADDVMAEAEKSPALFNIITEAIAQSVFNLEKTAELIEDKEPFVTVELLETIAFLAQALDESDDEVLQKKASLLDELLITVSAPKNAIAQAKQQTENELNELREKYRAKSMQDLYHDKAAAELHKMNNSDKIVSAIKDQVKNYRTLEAPLQTRYCPDHPGVSTVRVADRVYQCSLDKKIYNYEAGYTTMKGNNVPGGGVEYQKPNWNQNTTNHSVFDNRQSFMSRYASEDALKPRVLDYQYGIVDGENGKYIEVIVDPSISNERKMEIVNEIQSSMGEIYPILFK